jgi:hypothetical protein
MHILNRMKKEGMQGDGKTNPTTLPAVEATAQEGGGNVRNH